MSGSHKTIPAVRGKQRYHMIVTQYGVNSFQHVIDSVAVLKLEGWTGMSVTRLSHIQIIPAGLVTDVLFPYCRKQSFSEKQAVFFFFFLLERSRPNKRRQCTFLQSTDSSVWRRMERKRWAYGSVRFTLIRVRLGKVHVLV